jgi:Domain of unknown function (DUF397)
MKNVILAVIAMILRSGRGSNLNWIKSSLSYANGNCVQVAGLPDDEIIRIRDSKKPRGPVLKFTPDEWDAFIGGVLNGEFDRKSNQDRISATHPAHRAYRSQERASRAMAAAMPARQQGPETRAGDLLS